MLKKSYLPIFAAVILSCVTTVHGQGFEGMNPIQHLNLSRGTGPLDNTIFDISSRFGEAAGSVMIRVNNGYVSADANSDAWTVSETETTTFTSIGSRDVIAFVNHGRNLGSPAFQNGVAAVPRDGITSASGETWTFTTDNTPANFDTARYTVGSNANDYFVDYTGPETNQREFNPVGFRWQSDQPVSSFSVFTTNTIDLDNNYTVGFQLVSAVPEPASAMIVAFGGLLLLRRKRN